MVIKEFYTTRTDGVNLYRIYSDSGLSLLQNETGVIYGEAIDVEDAPYTYSETESPVDEEEASKEDLYNALSELGVSE